MTDLALPGGRRGGGGIAYFAFLVVLLLVLAGALTFLSGMFLTLPNLRNVARAMAAPGIVAVAGVLLMRRGGAFDLSVAGVMALAGAVLALTNQAGVPVWGAAALAVAAGGAVGVANGVLVTLRPAALGYAYGVAGTAAGLAAFLTGGFQRTTIGTAEIDRLALTPAGTGLLMAAFAVAIAAIGSGRRALALVRPLLVTLGTLGLIAAGIIVALSRGASLALQVPDATALRPIAGDVAPSLPAAAVVFVLVAVLASVILFPSRGQRTASGGAVGAYALSGAAAGLAGVVTTATLGMGSLAVSPITMLAVPAIVLLGGTALLGGRAALIGAVLATAMVAALQNGLVLIGLPVTSLLTAMAAVFLATLAIDQVREALARHRR